MLVNLNEFERIIELLNSDVLIVQILAVTFLRKLLSFEQDPPI